jgi:beta-1,4-mannosyltransferase
MMQDRRTRVAVVVVGDIGRSPRMQYHALALADAGAEVDLIGVAGSAPFAGVRSHPGIHLHAFGDGARPADGDRFVVPAALRAVRQASALFTALAVRRRAADVILVQSPPAIPTLAVALLAARLRGARLVIDWHNLGYAVLALRIGDAHPALRWATRYEAACGRRGDAHLCVSRALQQALAERWGIQAAVLYDRPARQFAPLSPERRERAVRELCARVGFHPQERPLLAISPTSWTADEDFALLLDALAQCAAGLPAAGAAAQLLVLLTGDGPLRAAYQARLAHLAGARVRAHALWLPADEYAQMLAAADLGLCLHRSASGLDLPMKIADMFGAGLPVWALDYGPCLHEIVRPGENAQLFASAAELAAQLCALMCGAPAETARLDRLRAGAAAAATERWDDAWRAQAATVVLGERVGRAASP